MILAFDRVDGEHPQRAIAFLHGILGRGLNLRSIAKRFIDARPEWSAWLVDLRGHGRSPKGSADLLIESTARDVLELASRSDLPLAAIVGHSFGGKVALETARLARFDSLHFAWGDRPVVKCREAEYLSDPDGWARSQRDSYPAPRLLRA